MPDPNPAALKFLATRRSVPPKMLTGPAPEGEALDTLLRTALRVPDHGKLEPWRLIVLQRAALDRLAGPTEAWMRARDTDEAVIAKVRGALQSPLIVAVVFSPVASDKIPVREQLMSAAAICTTLLSAALAAGWGAAWLTGPLSQDDFARTHLGLADGESIAGLIHIGTHDGASVADRPRPDPVEKINYA